MLVLTRRIGEAVVVGENEMNLTILGIKGNQVRLGFIASPDLSIHRHEIYNRIQLEKHQTHPGDALSVDKELTIPLKTPFKKPSNQEMTH